MAQISTSPTAISQFCIGHFVLWSVGVLSIIYATMTMSQIFGLDLLIVSFTLLSLSLVLPPAGKFAQDYFSA